MNKININFFIILFFLISSPFSTGQEDRNFEPTSGKLRFTYDELDLPGNEEMGFLGGTFLYDVNDWFSIGPAAYGSVEGERGGFITLGTAVEARKALSNKLSLNSGLFIGAGGGRGGFTLSGGGLMLRPHIGLYYNTEQFGNFGFGVSHTNFPSGTIKSTQAYLSYEYPFKTLVGDGWLDKNRSTNSGDKPLEASTRQFAVVYRNYSISQDVLTDSGSQQYKTIDLLGAEWLQYLNDNVFLKIESEGAMGGESNGYMQILFGGGYRFNITPTTSFNLTTQMGMAGGGNVATGGGLLTDVSIGLKHLITDNAFIGLNAGYVNAPDGDFDATSIAFQLGYQYGTPKINTISSLDRVSKNHLRARMTQQTYLKDNDDWRSHHSDLDVQNLGIQVDYFLNDELYLTGQGLAAYEGEAGAYMTGQVGAGIQRNLFDSNFFIGIEGLVGAAGGGGLAVGGGFIVQSNINLGFQISDSYSLLATAGYINATKGAFKAKVVGLSFSYKFTTFGI